MNWTEGDIDGVVLRPIAKHSDTRGWLAEIFRSDEIDGDHMPVMGYISVTHPGMVRGPHEHLVQTDTFGFLGPGNFAVVLWDNRRDSPTYGRTLTLTAGEDCPMIICIPPGIVHGYRNVSNTDAWLVNFPNRLFRGENKSQPVDEVRYEDKPDSPFRIE